jgi:hypothetical protein
MIDDYADTAGKRRKEHDTAHGTQPGDPAKAAEALINAIGSGKSPALLLLGSDAVSAFGTVLEAKREELQAWRDLSVSTDYPRT